MSRVRETLRPSDAGNDKGVAFLGGLGGGTVGPAIRTVRNWADLYLPRRAGLMATTAFFAATLTYGVVLGDHLEGLREGTVRATSEVAAVTGLGIHSVQISGADETSEDEIVEALDLKVSPSILTFDPFAARERLMELPWVEEATVQKLYPNTLRVDVREREAFALWQIGGIVSIVGRDGGAIEELTEPRFASLPLVVGYGANRKAADLMDAVRAHPRIAARFRAAVRVADRRWNVRLDNGVEVKLPEVDAAAAVAELAELDRDEALLARDLVAVDLRLPDRVILKLSEQAAVQRKASFQGRSGKNKGKSI